MNNDYKYQLLFIGDRKDMFDEIVTELRIRFDEFKIPKESLYCAFNDVSRIKGNQPIVIVVGHNSPNLPEKYLEWINSNEYFVNVILPVFLNEFSKEFEDTTLKRYNGIKYDSPKPIASIILEGFNILRKQRKLFISYRRTDSREVAIQLYNYFQERNFDVFLDSHSIPRGVDFQKNLFHKMMDCDAVLLLDTHDFLSSPYCREELEKAIANRIGILRIKWPKAFKVDYVGLIESVDLSPGGFECNGLLKEDILKKLHLQIEGLRIRSLASRQDALTTEFIETASRKCKRALQVYPNIIRMDLPEGNHIYFSAIGVPTSETFHYAEGLLQELLKKKDAEFTLIYDDLTLLQSWINHLDWLSNRTRLSILKKSEFETKL